MSKKFLPIIIFFLSLGLYFTWTAKADNFNVEKPKITILNVYSHPQTGDNWTVSFETKGKADLTITPQDQASIDDLNFVSLACGGEERTPQILSGDVIFYPNWQCEGIGGVIHLVNIAGTHTLKFQFADQIAYAYNTTPNFSGDYKWAWGENIGWNNFQPTNGGVEVASAGLTGYLWAENVGWIKLDYDETPGAENTSATNWGVTNDGTGNLGGYGWGENIGWVNFHPTHSQVTIDSSGNFSGYAWAENVGWIKFNHIQTDYTPKTTWPSTVPTASTVSDSPDPVGVGGDVTFTGNWSEPVAGGSVKMYICKDSSCTNCDSTTYTNCWCYSDDWVIEPTTTDTCSYTAQAADVGAKSYWLGVCDDSNDCDATPLSGGTFTVEYLQGCTRTFTVNPSLTFSISDLTAALGTLSSAAVSKDSTTFTVATNADSGYVVDVSGNTLTSGSDTIDAMTSAAASSPGTEQFGINLKDNSAPDVGAEPSGGSGAAASGYDTANNFKFISGNTIASCSGASDTTTFTISYIANISAVTEAGDYTTTLTLIATGKY